MARTAGKKQAPAKIEEDDDSEGWEDAVVEAEDSEQNLRLRDWRDVERYREMKELRRLVDDDYGLEEIFHIPLKPRAEPGIPVPRTSGKPTNAVAKAPGKVPPAKAVAAKAVPAKVAPAKAAPAKAAPRAHAKHAPKAHRKAPARLKAKAKRK